MKRDSVSISGNVGCAVCLVAASACHVYDSSQLVLTSPVGAESDAASEAAPVERDATADATVDASASGDEDAATEAFDDLSRDAAEDAEGAVDTARCESGDGCAACTASCAMTCSDAAINRGEAESDCDSPCPLGRCSNGSSCTSGATCATGYCRAQVCASDLAVRLAGDQAISFRRPISDDFTIELWINTTQSATGSAWWNGRYLFQADVNGSSNDYGTSILNGHFAAGTGNPEVTVSSNSVVTTGEWTHIAVTRVRATGTLSVLVNGVLEKSATGGNTAELTASSMSYLGSQTLTASGFIGEIDELRVWSVARTASEIAATMKKRLTGSEPKLVGYWRFDESTGIRFADSTTSKNDGTWLNAAEPVRVPSGVPMAPSP